MEAFSISSPERKSEFVAFFLRHYLTFSCHFWDGCTSTFKHKIAYSVSFVSYHRQRVSICSSRVGLLASFKPVGV